MATIVLGAVGGIVAGPVGAAIGAALGQQIDRAVLGPKGREGPRLADLSVQTSRYGAAIPKLFGAVRVAGTVIWATDLQEARSTVASGKGRPRSTQFSYSSSFAVLLSARPIVRVGRIWADGNLLRGASGDFKTQTVFRLHTGSEDQPVDPLIASAEGNAACPAYRGCAYAVFEDFALADYGNRIPSLSFEVFADDMPVSVGTIVQQLSANAITGAATAQLGGLAALGDSVRGVMDVVARALPLLLVDDGSALTLREQGGDAISLPRRALGTATSAATRAPIDWQRRSPSTIPETLSIAYSDAERDYQPGLQSARRDGAARRGDRIDLPATLTAAAARAIAEAKLTRLWRERQVATVRVPWRYLALRPGDVVTLPDTEQRWRITAMLCEAMAIELRLLPIANGTGVSGAIGVGAEPGRVLSQADAQHGPTTLMLIDLPAIEDRPSTDILLGVAANGSSPGWRRAALLVSRDEGASFTDMGITALPATIGTTVAGPAQASAAIIDRRSAIDVALLSPATALANVSPAELLGGANLAMVGRELVQFGRAAPLGGNLWRLTELLRGRRGTEAAINGHEPGERFVLIDRDTIALLDPRLAVPGVQVMAVGIGDGDDPPIATADTIGTARLPLSPVHAHVARTESGDTAITWVRRSRAGFGWDDGIDAPLSEESEAYRCTIMPAAGPPRSRDVTTPTVTYTASEAAADFASGASSVSIEIRQIGSFGLSLPLVVTLPLP